MPELSNIEACEKIDGSNFRPTLDRFCNVLRNIGLWNNEIKEAFDNFEWHVEDDQEIYSSITEIGHFASKISDIKIRPLVMVYNLAVDGCTIEHWISCELLIDAGELRSFEDGQFYGQTYDFVKALTIEMQKQFKQTGIYFTDEFQNGKDRDGVSSNNPEMLWQFDYALLPLTLEKLYSNKPKTHAIKRHDHYFEAWYIDRWKPKP